MTAPTMAGMCNRVGWWNHRGDHRRTDVEAAGHAVEPAMRMWSQDRTPEDAGPKAVSDPIRQDPHHFEPSLGAWPVSTRAKVCSPAGQAQLARTHAGLEA
ncbi:hypothetical protein AB0I77_37025 [Streptomyces sp. NPDC050619]|uniref:hypothetical protein n=1 Tax=Streptomyces sp. NPDC050619 TaxID=3157214 RepID=UPI0034217DED